MRGGRVVHFFIGDMNVNKLMVIVNETINTIARASYLFPLLTPAKAARMISSRITENFVIVTAVECNFPPLWLTYKRR
jgi:hypothetical protein